MTDEAAERLAKAPESIAESLLKLANPPLMVAGLRAVIDPLMKPGEMKLITPCNECGGTIYHRPHCSGFKEIQQVSIK